MEGQNITMKTEKEATADLLMTKEILEKEQIRIQYNLHSTAGALDVATAEVLDIAKTEANKSPEIRMVMKCEKHHIHFTSEKDTINENALMTQDIKTLLLKKFILFQLVGDVNHKDKQQWGEGAPLTDSRLDVKAGEVLAWPDLCAGVPGLSAPPNLPTNLVCSAKVGGQHLSVWLRLLPRRR